MSSVQKKTAVAPANAGSAQIDALSSEILELQRIRENLQTELRQRDEFFSTAAHELRNPLNALHLTLAGITRAQSGSTPIAAEQVLSRINKAAVQVKRLADLIDEMLIVSRIDSRRLQFKIEEFDAAERLKEIVARSGGSASSIELVAPGPITIQCDRPSFERIATSLLSNAIKSGDGKPVEVRLESKEAMVRVEVTDHGIGLSEEDQARIFDRFERPGKASKQAGLGLGLWIASETAKALGGQIRVISEIGRGCTFIVELPRNNSMDNGR